MRQRTTLASWILSICKSGEPYGVDATNLLKIANVDFHSQNASENRVPIEAMEHVWAELVKMTNDHSVGLNAASYITPMTFHTMAMAVQSSTTLQDALSTMQKYLSVIHDGIWFEIEKTNDNCLSMTLRQRGDCPSPSAQTVDAGLAIYFKILTEWIGLPRQEILSVQFTRPRPSDPSKWEDHFGVALDFSCEHSGFNLSNKALEFPIVSANPMLKMIGESALEAYTKSSQKPVIVSLVRNTLITSLESGETPTQDSIARTLGISCRSLRRMLKEKNTTYTRVRDEVRREIAEHLLTSSSLSISEVAWRLGIQNTSTFNRLFKNWSSSTPMQFRKRNSQHR